jgi:hypothetical protein
MVVDMFLKTKHIYKLMTEDNIIYSNIQAKASHFYCDYEIQTCQECTSCPSSVTLWDTIEKCFGGEMILNCYFDTFDIDGNEIFRWDAVPGWACSPCPGSYTVDYSNAPASYPNGNCSQGEFANLPITCDPI